MRSELRYDPRPALRKLRVPVLAVVGGKDLRVPADVNTIELERALRAAGHPDVTVKSFPELDHSLAGPIDGEGRNGAINPVVLELITKWTLGHVRPEKQGRG
jgi:pimeloyl-ACP methyl ester carboxylesterase